MAGRDLKDLRRNSGILYRESNLINNRQETNYELGLGQAKTAATR